MKEDNTVKCANCKGTGEKLSTVQRYNQFGKKERVKYLCEICGGSGYVPFVSEIELERRR